MTNNSPSQDFPFSGYRFHKKQTNLADLWDKFKAMQSQSAAWHSKRDDRGQYGTVSKSWREREVIKEQIKNEGI